MQRVRAAARLAHEIREWPIIPMPLFAKQRPLAYERLERAEAPKAKAAARERTVWLHVVSPCGGNVLAHAAQLGVAIGGVAFHTRMHLVIVKNAAPARF